MEKSETVGSYGLDSIVVQSLSTSSKCTSKLKCELTVQDKYTPRIRRSTFRVQDKCKCKEPVSRFRATLLSITNKLEIVRGRFLNRFIRTGVMEPHHSELCHADRLENRIEEVMLRRECGLSVLARFYLPPVVALRTRGRFSFAFLTALLFVIAPLFLPTAVAQTPTIRQIALQGNDILSAREISDVMAIVPGGACTSETMDRAMRAALEAYRQIGRLWAEINLVIERAPLDSSARDVTVRIHEGPLAKVDKLLLNGDTVWPPGDLLAAFDSRGGSLFDAVLLERDIERMLARYEQNGYPYCRVNVTHLDQSYGKFSIELTVVPGPFIRVGAFQITGNRSTQARVVSREFRLRRGDPFDQRHLDRGYDRLRRLGLFSEVNRPAITMNSVGDSVTIGVAVTEARANLFDGAVGYTPGGAGQAGFLTGSFTLSMRNMLGTGRRMEIAWNRRSLVSSDLTLGYEEPWVLGAPLTMGFDFGQLNQDTLYTATQFGLSASLPLSAAIDGEVHVGWRRVIPDSLSRQALGLSREYSARLGANVDSRDSPINPSNGSRVSLSVEYGVRFNRASSTFQPERLRSRTTSARVDIEHYRPLWGHHVVALAVHGVERQSPEQVLPVSQQYFLGGARSLRGYRENEFHGNRVAWSSVEYRLLLSSLSRFFLFVDNAYIEYPQRAGTLVQRVKRVKSGYGIGLRVESSLGVLGVDYGVGEADSPLNGKVHIAFQNVF